MEFPKRTSQHITETTSWKIFQSKVPSPWIVRELTERDYGIDSYIELVSKEGLVTGELCSIQLKGSDSISWSTQSTDLGNCVKFTDIKKSTINYWMNLPVPVFLLWVDISKAEVLFTPIKQQIQKYYSKYMDAKSKTLSFDFYKKLQLGTEFGNAAFVWFYFREKNKPQFVSYLRMLLTHWNQYSDFIVHAQGTDEFMEVDKRDQLLMKHIYQCCQFMAEYLDIKWEVIDLDAVYRKDREIWKDTSCSLHGSTLTQILKELQPVFFQIIEKLKDLITKEQPRYWIKKDIILFNMCLNIDTSEFKKYR